MDNFIKFNNQTAGRDKIFRYGTHNNYNVGRSLSTGEAEFICVQSVYQFLTNDYASLLLIEANHALGFIFPGLSNM